MRRRIVIVPLVALLVVVIGGGYLGWRWSQDQYYIGANSKGQVMIYRGVNQRIAGISLSSSYQATGIRLAQVPTPYQQTVKATDAASSLGNARAIVANVQNAVNTCKQAYLARQAWVAMDNLYQAYKAAVAEAARQHKKPPAAVANPGAEPSRPGPYAPRQRYSASRPPTSSRRPRGARERRARRSAEDGDGAGCAPRGG